MSRTLNLVDLLLNSGRHLQDIGRSADAIEVLTRLADFRKLPGHIIEEIQALLANLYLEQKQYSKARRHLTAAMAFRPLKAEYHHLMAIAIEEDDQADLRRAEMYYAKAAELDSDNATHWVDYGMYLLRLGKQSLGLTAIRKAFDRGIDDADIVGQVAEALRQADLFEEAAAKLRTALFHNHSAHHFQELWQYHQFQTIRGQQERQRSAAGGKKGPVVLPFTPKEQSGKFIELGEKTIRIDQEEPLSGPRSPRPLPFRRRRKG